MGKNVLITIEYDGTNFKGWQRQEGERTVQNTLEEALENVLGERVSIEGAGRTDAGVHAYGQRATFVTDSGLPIDKLTRVTNNFLSTGNKRTYPTGDVRLIAAEEVPEDFHARFSCVGKTYGYKLLISNEPDIFKRNHYYRIVKEPDMDSMQKALEKIKGKKDFACFQAAGGTPRKTTVRTVFDIKMIRAGSELTLFVTGDGFLYNMVRIMVGTLVDIGMGKLDPNKIEEIINSCDRQKAGHTAPPSGLYLYKVYYSEEEMKRWIDPIGMNIL